jgi:very-short-patch-repair endonuclease
VPLSIKKRCAEVIVHQTRSPLTQRRTRRGVPTTTPERTLIDLAGSLTPEQLEIAFETARRDRHVTTASVERALARIGARGRRGSEPMQQLLATLAPEPPCESALEVLTARMLRASGLPRPERQVSVTAFDADYRLDFAWPDEQVALECDGRKWHEIEADFERDRQRWSAITAATGYRIVWATWQRVSASPDHIVAELRRLLDQAAGESPSPRRGRARRARAERSVGSGMTLSSAAPTTVSRAFARPDDASTLAPRRVDTDG